MTLKGSDGEVYAHSEFFRDVVYGRGQSLIRRIFLDLTYKPSSGDRIVILLPDYSLEELAAFISIVYTGKIHFQDREKLSSVYHLFRQLVGFYPKVGVSTPRPRATAQTTNLPSGPSGAGPSSGVTSVPSGSSTTPANRRVTFFSPQKKT